MDRPVPLGFDAGQILVDTGAGRVVVFGAMSANSASPIDRIAVLDATAGRVVGVDAVGGR